MPVKAASVKGKIRLSDLMASWGLPEGLNEVVAVPGRKFRLDWADPVTKVAIEQQGGIFMARGGHNRMGRLRDNEKLNLCQLEGWLVLQFTPKELWGGYATDTIKAALISRGWKA